MHGNAQNFEWKTVRKISLNQTVRIACLDDAFSGILELEASPVEGQSLQQKYKKGRKRKGEKKWIK